MSCQPVSDADIAAVHCPTCGRLFEMSQDRFHYGCWLWHGPMFHVQGDRPRFCYVLRVAGLPIAERIGRSMKYSIVGETDRFLRWTWANSNKSRVVARVRYPRGWVVHWFWRLPAKAAGGR